MQKMMFRVAFHGGIGNVWKALMTIPEARNIKRCMNKQDNCMAFEVLRKEVETLDDKGYLNSRIIENKIIWPSLRKICSF